jgi:hypothetical protein
MAFCCTFYKHSEHISEDSFPKATDFGCFVGYVQRIFGLQKDYAEFCNPNRRTFRSGEYFSKSWSLTTSFVKDSHFITHNTKNYHVASPNSYTWHWFEGVGRYQAPEAVHTFSIITSGCMNCFDYIQRMQTDYPTSLRPSRYHLDYFRHSLHTLQTNAGQQRQNSPRICSAQSSTNDKFYPLNHAFVFKLWVRSNVSTWEENKRWPA